MSSNFSFGTQGERKKSTKQSRFGGKATTTKRTTKKIIRNELTKSQMTPNQRAAYTLGKELERYPKVSKDTRNVYKNRLAGLPTLRTMNMSVLAGALVLLDSSASGEPEPGLFDGPIWQQVTKNLHIDAKKQMIAKTTLTTYMAAVSEYFATNDQTSADYTPAMIEEVPEALEDPTSPGEPIPETEEEEEDL